jgi:DNA topoisomerase-2
LAGLSTESVEFVPYYEGFQGSVRRVADQKFLIRGVYSKIGEDKIRITELPVGTWTMPYTTFLESLMDGGVDKAGKKMAPSIRDFTSVCTEVAVDFTVVFPKGKLAELEAAVDSVTGINGIEKLLKLTTSVSTTNMHMFNAEFKLHKYATVEEIIDAFYVVRMDTYRRRKEAQIVEMKQRLLKLSNRARYIQETLSGAIDLRRKTGEVVVTLLEKMRFDRMDGEYKYLVKMPMDSVTEENVAQLMREKTTTEEELAKLTATSLETIWLNELDALDKEYVKFKTRREKIQAGGIGGGSEKKKKVVVRKK